jgi:hypothetical protein
MMSAAAVPPTEYHTKVVDPDQARAAKPEEQSAISVGAPKAPLASFKIPVLFSPFTVDAPFQRVEEYLRQKLIGVMIEKSGRTITEAASGETDKIISTSTGSIINREEIKLDDWIRRGQGIGAKILISGKISGDEKTCTVFFKRVFLENRTSDTTVAKLLSPCGLEQLDKLMDVAAMALVGGASQAAESSSSQAVESGASPAVERDEGTDKLSPAPALKPQALPAAILKRVTAKH